MSNTTHIVAVDSTANFDLPPGVAIKQTNISFSQSEILCATSKISQPQEVIDVPSAMAAPVIEANSKFLKLTCKNGEVISVPMNSDAFTAIPPPMPMVRVPLPVSILRRPSVNNTSPNEIMGNSPHLLTLLQRPLGANQPNFTINGIPHIEVPYRCVGPLPPQSAGMNMPIVNFNSLNRTPQPRVFTVPMPNLPPPLINDKENSVTANVRRVSLQLPILHRPHPAKTITTPCYTNMPRVCPEQIISNPSPRVYSVGGSNVINNHDYSKPSPLILSSIPQGVINQHDYSRPLPPSPLLFSHSPHGLRPHNYPPYSPRCSTSPQIRLTRPPNFTSFLTSTPQPQRVNSNEKPQINHLRSLLRGAISSPSEEIDDEQDEDPIGLLVPEVQLVEDHNQKVTIPQWSPRVTALKYCGRKVTKNVVTKRKLGDNISIKKCKVVLKRLNMSVFNDGVVNLRKMRQNRLFLKANLTEKPTAKKRKLIQPEVIEIEDDKNETTETENRAEPNNIRCLVYKSLGFTHVIPLEDVISIPNEILDRCVPAMKSSDSVCNQLEKLVTLGCSSNLEVVPQFESLDLKNVTSANLDSDLLQKLSQSFNSTPDVNARLKINSLRDKLTFALARAELQKKSIALFEETKQK